jgi:hypothetical protein
MCVYPSVLGDYGLSTCCFCYSSDRRSTPTGPAFCHLIVGLICSLESPLVLSLSHSAVWSAGLVLGLSYACLSVSVWCCPMVLSLALGAWCLSVPVRLVLSSGAVCRLSGATGRPRDSISL